MTKRKKKDILCELGKARTAAELRAALARLSAEEQASVQKDVDELAESLGR